MALNCEYIKSIRWVASNSIQIRFNVKWLWVYLSRQKYFELSMGILKWCFLLGVLGRVVYIPYRLGFWINVVSVRSSAFYFCLLVDSWYCFSVFFYKHCSLFLSSALYCIWLDASISSVTRCIQLLSFPELHLEQFAIDLGLVHKTMIRTMLYAMFFCRNNSLKHRQTLHLGQFRLNLTIDRRCWCLIRNCTMTLIGGIITSPI